MSRTLTFTLPGEPVAKQRPKFRRFGKGMVSTYTPAPTREYEARVHAAAVEAAKEQGYEWGDDDRFHVLVTVHRRHNLKGGDIDNYTKSVLDGMNGAAFGDDSRVVTLTAILCTKSCRPMVEVTVTAVTHDAAPCEMCAAVEAGARRRRAA